MSRPIKITDDLRKQMEKDFLEYIDSHGFHGGVIDFKRTYKWEGTGKASRALISFEPDAYLKMEMLVKNFTTEVAWHFTVERRDNDEYAAEYHITDTLVFPQLVNVSHFEQDDTKCDDCNDTKYNRWKMALTDDQWNHLRGHGHSHVNAAVSPSPTDENYQKDMVDAYEDFYLFVIWNKSGDKNVWIYDIEHNVLFEKSDVDIVIESDTLNLTEFMDEARTMTKPMPYVTNTFGAGRWEDGRWISNYSAPATTSYQNNSKTQTPASQMASPTSSVVKFNGKKQKKNKKRADQKAQGTTKS